MLNGCELIDRKKNGAHCRIDLKSEFTQLSELWLGRLEREPWLGRLSGSPIACCSADCHLSCACALWSGLSLRWGALQLLAFTSVMVCGQVSLMKAKDDSKGFEGHAAKLLTVDQVSRT